MKDYIPKSKSDIKAVKYLRSLTFETVRADVPELLECMQDMHWEIAQGIADYLIPHIDDINYEIITILKTNDEVWKFSIISSLLAKSMNKLDQNIVLILKRIAEHPTKSEIEDEVNIIAKEVLRSTEYNA